LTDQERIKQNDVVRTLVKALAAHHPSEGKHSDRVSVYSVMIGHEIGMSEEDLLALRYAAELHDVGKISVDKSLLSKLGKLTDDEMDALRLHSELAMAILESFEFLEPSLPMIRHHHERWDGQGYPDGLAAEDIPLGARIIAVAETFDTLMSPPPWREPLNENEALAEIDRSRSTQLDPALVDAFKKVQPLIQPV
jgi:HD-GYP domain-containing protein (c-di-GMP phosphodiesterase class II)